MDGVLGEHLEQWVRLEKSLNIPPDYSHLQTKPHVDPPPPINTEHGEDGFVAAKAYRGPRMGADFKKGDKGNMQRGRMVTIGLFLRTLTP